MMLLTVSGTSIMVLRIEPTFLAAVPAALRFAALAEMRHRTILGDTATPTVKVERHSV
jgi:hypothetical protein